MGKEEPWGWARLVASITAILFTIFIIFYAFYFFPNSPILYFALFLILAVIIIFFSFIFSRPVKDSKEYWLEKWEYDKKIGKVKVDENLRVVEGEKVIIGLTPCYVEAYSIGGFRYYPRDIIVTDRRIAVGFFSLFNESFGKMNIWFSERLNGSESGELLGLLGGDSVASSMKIIDTNGKKNLKAEVKHGPLNITFMIYHPNAERIEKLFRDANGQSK